MADKIISSGAEAVIIKKSNSIIKKRVSKGYRISKIDNKLRKSRTRREAKVLDKLNGQINVPSLISMDDKEMTVEMDFIKGDKLAIILNNNNYKSICESVGKQVAIMHSLGNHSWGI